MNKLIKINQTDYLLFSADNLVCEIFWPAKSEILEVFGIGPMDVVDRETGESVLGRPIKIECLL